VFYKAFSYLADMDYDGETGNFRIMSRKVVTNFRAMHERLRFFGGLVAWMGFPTTSIEVQHDERFAGKTSYTFRKLWKLASETIIAYSDKPLRLSIRFGFAISVLAFAYGSYIIYRALIHDAPIIGWSSLIVSLYFLGGIIISILGILGVYLGKTFDETKRRPLYIIIRTTFDDPSAKL
jgi:polyisoprenyl-phosphate glycosyltransferase